MPRLRRCWSKQALGIQAAEVLLLCGASGQPARARPRPRALCRRNPNYNFVRFAMTICIALILGLVYLNQARGPLGGQAGRVQEGKQWGESWGKRHVRNSVHGRNRCWLAAVGMAVGGVMPTKHKPGSLLGRRRHGQ